MPTATETAIENTRPDPEAGMFLADRAVLPVPEGERASESTGLGPPFEAGVAAAFGSGWPTLGEQVRRWS